MATSCSLDGRLHTHAVGFEIFRYFLGAVTAMVPEDAARPLHETIQPYQHEAAVMHIPQLRHIAGTGKSTACVEKFLNNPYECRDHPCTHRTQHTSTRISAPATHPNRSPPRAGKKKTANTASREYGAPLPSRDALPRSSPKPSLWAFNNGDVSIIGGSLLLMSSSESARFMLTKRRGKQPTD